VGALRLSDADGLRFAPLLANASEALAPFVTPGSTETERRKQIDRMAVVCRFLVASSLSAAFYSRRDKVFWAYEWALEPGPGHVLLDATADLGPVVAFLPGVQRPSLAPPAVDYSNLEIIHVPMPKEFTNAKKTLAKATSGRAYAEWIKRVITTLAPQGADVLMGAHLSLFELEFFPAAYDPTKPLDLDGRQVVVNHWGSGIGSNRYKHCTHVFQFNEWYQKRGATIATVHGHRGEAVTDEQLRNAEGRRTSSGDYQPRGVYRSAAENHLLR
jgi:hypothetical protein